MVDLSATQVLPWRDASYEQLLRAIGARFDASGANGLTILETEQGFLLQGGDTNGQRSGASLATHGEILATVRLGPTGRQLRRPARNEGRQGAYEDVLRTLGYLLDRDRATNVLIQEIAKGLLVTYRQRRPSSQPVLVQLFGSRQLAHLLDSAYARRRDSDGSSHSPLLP